MPGSYPLVIHGAMHPSSKHPLSVTICLTICFFLAWICFFQMWFSRMIGSQGEPGPEWSSFLPSCFLLRNQRVLGWVVCVHTLKSYHPSRVFGMLPLLGCYRHHQDQYAFGRGSQPKPSSLAYWEGGASQVIT